MQYFQATLDRTPVGAEIVPVCLLALRVASMSVSQVVRGDGLLRGLMLSVMRILAAERMHALRLLPFMLSTTFITETT